jgi:hypothetical protein
MANRSPTKDIASFPSVTDPTESPPPLSELDSFSSSVRDVAKRLGPSATVSSWEIVRGLCQIHPEYGDGFAEKLTSEEPPRQQEKKRVIEWLAEAKQNVEMTPRNGIVDGRRLILALARLDQDLSQFLSKREFLSLLEKEINEKERHPLTPDSTHLHNDNPAADDELGRESFAKLLATRLEALWNENLSSEIDNSFILHLHGPWGAGKSSLLNLLRDQLQPEQSNGSSSRWLVVDFNAWQHQRINPPWWPLLDRIYREGKRQLRDTFLERSLAARLKRRELWWRFCTANIDRIVLAGIVIAIAVLIWCIGPFLLSQLLLWLKLDQKSSDAASKAVSVVTSVTTLIVGISTFGRTSALSGSARAAQTFVQAAVDPMARITKHFTELIGDMGDHPMIVLIDDLDRCQAEYTVGLLEGIQTLFKDRRVIYLISADRRWLQTCYEKVYKEFAESIKEPGRSLGSLFLEKAVQLSISLPRLTPELQDGYWKYLIGQGNGNERQVKKNEATAKAESEFKGLRTPDDIAKAIRMEENDPLLSQARREQAVLQLAKEQAERLTAHFLQGFAHLLQPNPRAMKRLLNAYAFHRDLGILAGLDVFQNVRKRKQLVLWTIVCLRWPMLEEALMENLEYADLILLATPMTNAPKELQELFRGAPEWLQKLLISRSVKAVFSGQGLDIILDKTIVAEFAGLRTSNSSASAVG